MDERFLFLLGLGLHKTCWNYFEYELAVNIILSEKLICWFSVIIDKNEVMYEHKITIPLVFYIIREANNNLL